MRGRAVADAMRTPPPSGRLIAAEHLSARPVPSLSRDRDREQHPRLRVTVK